MDKIINWGIIGTGHIANKFAETMKSIKGAKLFAVASRTSESANEFAKKYNIQTAYSSYAELANDKNIDAVYVSTPHPYHMENTLLYLNEKKAVLCEKPIAMNEIEASKMVDASIKNNVFLMEAMWTRFLPITYKIRSLIADGIIGDIRMVRADFCFKAEFNPNSRLLNKTLGGGALLDVGIYVTEYATMLLGSNPTEIHSTAHIGKTGVDEQSSILLKYKGGEIATLSCAVQTKTPTDAYIYGTNGYIEVPNFVGGNKATIYIEGKEPEIIEVPVTKTGYEGEIYEAMKCIRAGKIESDLLPHNESINVMKIFDEVRSQWGLVYTADA